MYVEWLTPFHSLDPATGMYVVSRSTRMHRPYAEIVEASRLVRNCYLQPVCGRAMDRAWTSDKVADLCSKFLVKDKKKVVIVAYSHKI